LLSLTGSVSLVDVLVAAGMGVLVVAGVDGLND